MTKRLDMKGIGKSFFATRALDNVNFTCVAGEVHALVGLNGAGKSTLMKILGGVYQKDEGVIEIDGKDAGMMLLRDIAFYGRDDLLDGANLILIPILSVDGHERASAYSRPNQRGPRIQGWRNTATNQNLNRDYMKLDQPEMQAVRGLILKYQPDLYVDIHVTDGLDYQYDVTYGYNGENGVWSRSPETARWLDSAFKPAMNDALEAQGHIPGELVFGIDDQNPRAGLSDGGLGERFSNGWGSKSVVLQVDSGVPTNILAGPVPHRATR